jgi:uncharacterized protein YceH (UPF0502 family)
MLKILSEVEVRVVSSLVEKQVTTPEYYPLTLNALTQACNQKSNREPVVSFGEPEVVQALESLREKNLVYVFYGSSSRVPKYKHMMPEVFHLDGRELAVLCVLMLRGPQTAGELRERANRLATFTTPSDVEEALKSLMENESQPLVTKLARRQGQKEARYAHILAGDVVAENQVNEDFVGDSPAKNLVEAERLAKLEGEVEDLRAEVLELRQRLGDFMKQFDA